MLKIALAKSKTPASCTDIMSLPHYCAFIVYLTILKDTLCVTRLVKKLKYWFDEGRKNHLVTGLQGKKQKRFPKDLCLCSRASMM